MNKERQTEIVYTEKELRQMREDDLFQERYWNDECYDGVNLPKEVFKKPKPYVYGSDKHMDFVIDELKRLKQIKEKRNENK